jgi:hypothetical protein
MRAEELAAEFGIAGNLRFVNTEHGLVKAAISPTGLAGELYLQGAQVTAWRPGDERPVLLPAQERIRTTQGDPWRHPDHIPMVRPES